MKRLFLILCFFSGNAFAEAWGPELIQFDLEGGEKMETMLWISGFSYSSSAFYSKCGALKENEYVGSKYLIEVLNRKFSGQTITSEQATELLSNHLRMELQCTKAL